MESPLDIMISPEFPAVDLPVLSDIDPDTPWVPASADEITIDPVEDCSLKEDPRKTFPLDPLLAGPLVIIRSPPSPFISPVPLPAPILMSPPFPPHLFELAPAARSMA